MQQVMKRRAVLLAVFGVATALSVGTAVAAFPDDGVKTYTGCLTSGGNVNYVKEGDAPAQPCGSPKQVVKLSGGDITKVVVTGALTGGGDNGAVSIGLDAAKTVPSACASLQVPKWDTTVAPARWSCGADNDTQYAAGTGLDLTGTTFSVRPDAFTAGTGLSRTGTTFSVQPDAFTKKGQSCGAGTFATGSDGSGALTCAAPAATLPAFHTASGIELWANEPRSTKTLATLTLPAGTWALQAQVAFVSADTDEQPSTCQFPGVTPSEGSASTFVLTPGGETNSATVAIKVSLAAQTSVSFTCNAVETTADATVTALQVQ